MKEKVQVSRIKKVILNDRLEVEEGFLKVFSMDLINLLENYFSLNSPPSISLNRSNDTILVSINFSSQELKQFSSLTE